MLYMCVFPACCFRQTTCVAQGLFNGVLNETWTYSCFQYKWPLLGQTGLYRDRCSSFLECVNFGLLYMSLIFDMFIVVCVCVFALEWFWISLTALFVCVGVYHGEFCGLNLLVDLSPFFCICIHISVYVCIWVFSFVWEHVWHNV